MVSYSTLQNIECKTTSKFIILFKNLIRIVFATVTFYELFSYPPTNVIVFRILIYDLNFRRSYIKELSKPKA